MIRLTTQILAAVNAFYNKPDLFTTGSNFVVESSFQISHSTEVAILVIGKLDKPEVNMSDCGNNYLNPQEIANNFLEVVHAKCQWKRVTV